MKKLILIDGYSFLFRAFFAIRNLTRSDGTPVGALYGFTRMLIKIMTDIEYSHIAVVFDCGGKTFRNELYEEYKANRPPCPEELKPQFPLVREIVNVLNIRTLEKIGYEADDIIATYAKKAESEGFDVIIVSSDKDLMQLIDDKILMFDGMKNELIDTNKVIEKWGVQPKQLLDVLSLMGDASDNVPGVPSIGPKTAAELITQYDTLENLLNNLSEIKQNKRREVLIENKDKAILSKKLITLDENVKIGYTIDDLAFKQYDYRELFEFLKAQNFNSMVKGLEKAFNDIPLFEEKKEIKIANNKLITDLNELNDLLEKIKDDGKFYFKIILEKNNILAIAFSGIDNNIYCIKTSDSTIDLFLDQNKEILFSDAIKFFKNIFEDSSVLKITFNIKEQIKILEKYDISINSFEDIEVINYILNAGLFAGNLSTMITKILEENEDDEKNIELLKEIESEHKIDNLSEKIVDLSYFIIKSIKPLYTKLKDGLGREKLTSAYETIERPITQILADMEILGVKINTKKLNELSKEFQNNADILAQEIYAIAGEEFNIGSPKQLGEILFIKLKLSGGKKSAKSGNLSTNVEILEDLADNGCEICQKILIWRHYTKLKNTYTEILPKLVDKNNRIHTTYSNTYVVTGRLSSSNPNLQNIPIKTESGSKIRSAFIAREGYKLISADYKQAELRIMANLQNVKKLKEFFLSGKDIHTTTASKVFKVPEDQITHEMRSIAKAINFSIIYGTGTFGLAKRIKSSREEARQYLENYFETYPEIKHYIEETKKFVNENAYVKTMFGRKCNIDVANAKPIMKANLERLAINAPIQGTAADIIKKAMISLSHKLKNYKSKIIMQIHDELVLECPEEEISEVSNILKNTMESVVDWEVKMEVDLGVGDNLEEML